MSYLPVFQWGLFQRSPMFQTYPRVLEVPFTGGGGVTTLESMIFPEAVREDREILELLVCAFLEVLE
jgi:hypothetical protein